MHLVRLVIALTPYGVLALMTKVAASSDSQDIWNLLEFIAVSYLAIFLMFESTVCLYHSRACPLLRSLRKHFPHSFCVHIAVLCGDDPAQHRNSGEGVRKSPQHCQLVGQFWCNHWPKWLRWDIPGDACRDDCSFSGPGSFSA